MKSCDQFCVVLITCKVYGFMNKGIRCVNVHNVTFVEVYKILTSLRNKRKA